LRKDVGGENPPVCEPGKVKNLCSKEADHEQASVQIDLNYR
jgi:hypothetical protein